MSLPTQLAAAAATWQRDVDVVVLGSGAAGLSAALAARPVRSVLVVTKDVLWAGSTQWAQGGLAGVLHPTDTLEDHVRDTLDAGAGLCDAAVVRELVTEAPKSIRYLMRLGAAFDPEPGQPHDSETIALTREGGHSHNRIVHAGGDRSGAEVQRTLDESALGAGVEVLSHGFALDVVLGTGPDGERQAAGVRIGLLDEAGQVVSVGIVTARAVVMASGGFGQIFASTSNPPAVTGDGMAIALRAGLSLRDVEFVQFHPTVMWRGPDAVGQQALVSEAVRGEGAILYDAAGERVMAGVHPLEDLAPRDVVADGDQPADGRGAGRRRRPRVPRRHPHGRAVLRAVPVDHRGVPRDRHRPGGRPDPGRPRRALCVRGYPGGPRRRHRAAAGSTRWGRSPARVSTVRTGWPPTASPSRSCPARGWAATWPGSSRRPSTPTWARTNPSASRSSTRPDRREVRAVMSRHVGVVRDASSLAAAAGALGAIARDLPAEVPPSRRSWEGTNLLTVAAAVVAAAQARTESRGCHRRTDYPDARPDWLTHLDVTLDAVGALDVAGGPT